MDGASIKLALSFARRYDEVFAIVGRHPNSAAGFDDYALEEIKRAAGQPMARAIGETGLDYYRDHASREDQRRAFAAQLDLAQELGLPVVIHTRQAEMDTFDVLRTFRVRPNRELGQNFLIDDNILRLVGQAAELEPDDVVLEVGGGLGVLSEFLAERVRALHVVEVDEGLRAALEDAVGGRAGVQLHFADALSLDYASLEPAPLKVVANLPYGIAATVVLK